MRTEIRNWIRSFLPVQKPDTPPAPPNTNVAGSISKEEMTRRAAKRDRYYDCHCVNCDRLLFDKPKGQLVEGVERAHRCGKKVICHSCHYETFSKDWCRHGVAMDSDCVWCRETSCKHNKNPRNCMCCCPGVGANSSDKGLNV